MMSRSIPESRYGLCVVIECGSINEDDATVAFIPRVCYGALDSTGQLVVAILINYINMIEI